MTPVSLDSRRLYFQQSRSDDRRRPAILLLHGAGGSHLVWPDQIRELDKRWVLALDLPGHGRSDLPGRRSVDHYAQAVESFINEVGLENPVIAGHSLGGAIALAMALRCNIPIRGIVLLGTSARMPVGDTLLGGLLESLPRAADFIVDNGFARAPDAVRAQVRRQIIATSATTTFGDFLACSRFDMRPHLKSILTPALVFAGAADRLTPPRFIQSLAAGLVNSQLVLLEEAGHFAMLEQPEAVARAIEDFIRALPDK